MEQAIHYLTHEFAPFTGGIGIYIEEMALASEQAGINPVVWAPDYGGHPMRKFPFRVERVHMRGKQDWLCRWRMGRAFARQFAGGGSARAVVLAEPGPIRWWMYGWLTRPPACGRLVVILHGSELQKLTAMAHRRYLLSRLLKKADCIGVVSREICKSLLSVYPELEQKTVVVPGAVRASWHKESIPEWNIRRKEIIQVGRIHPRKGQLELVQAVGKLPDALRSEFKLRLIGPVAMPRYAKQVSQAATAHRVNLEMTGLLNEADLMDAYRRAVLAVMPSQPYKSSIEGLGMALLEAQHFGLPVIGTDVGGVREAMIPDQTGILVSASELGDLTTAILSLLDNPGRAQLMGSNGSRFVRQTFSWNKNLHSLGLV